MCRCKSRCGGICPFTFGIALGLTAGIGVILWSAWVMYYGMPHLMSGYPDMSFSWADSIKHALWAVLKGFVFGFVLILIYDGLLCCKKKMCKKDDKKCEGKCCCCSPDKK
ncbi:MAG TPA: hypothetical protein VNC84_05520 [Gammaproteobacteria bacterium]|jgi:hypothetical protein|nr:hypothetical protein [Gammaproteobacteria bacterium]